jgi:cysteine desulfurase
MSDGAYLDHAAARPVDPRVRAAMLPFLNAAGSPSSLHDAARAPAEAIEAAREHVAALIGAPPDSIIFTSGSTESRNLAVKGLLSANRRLGRHLVTSAVDHPSTLAACRTAERDGATLTVLGVDDEGYVSSADVAAAIGEETALVCLSHGQAEVGTVQRVADLCRAVRNVRAETIIHIDGEETVGLVPVAVDDIGCDALTLGGGSLAAPPWTGALYVRPATRLHPLIEGGLQEHGKRAGAEDVAGIAALGEAARLALGEGADRAANVRALRDRLVAALLEVPDVRLNGPSGDGRLPGNVQVSVAGVEGETLVLMLDAMHVAASPGSACTAAGKASPVLEAMGLEPRWTHSAILFSLSWTTTEGEIDHAARAFRDVVTRLRAMSPLTP